MTVLRRFDCVLAGTDAKVVAEHERGKGGKLAGDALDTKLNKVAGQRFDAEIENQHNFGAKLHNYGRDDNRRAYATAASDNLQARPGGQR